MGGSVAFLFLFGLPAAVGLVVAPSSKNRPDGWDEVAAQDQNFHVGHVHDDNRSSAYDTPDLSWDPLLFANIGWNGKQLLCMMKKRMYWKAKYAWPFMRQNPNVFPRPGFKKCAAVSSSGVLRWHRHGRGIDRADLVMRFNDAPAGGIFSPIVGRRDDMRYVNNHFAWRVLARKTRSFRYDPRTLVGVTHLSTGASNIRSRWTFNRRFPRNNLHILKPDLWKAMRGFLRYAYGPHWFRKSGISYQPTTGGTGLAQALYLCREIRLYGFAATPRSRKSPYHFYKGHLPGKHSTADKNSYHKTFSAEKDLWRRLAVNSDWSIDKHDVAVIKGFRSVNCKGVYTR